MKQPRFCDHRHCQKELAQLARIIHEGFYSNRRAAAATRLRAGLWHAGGLAARSVNILFKDASLLRGSTRPSRWRLSGFVTNPHE
jgi:hypothetical protein